MFVVSLDRVLAIFRRADPAAGAGKKTGTDDEKDASD
jgi:hypothetical protein